MASRYVTSAALAAQPFHGVTLAGVFGELLGAIDLGAYGLIWGPPGGGKSTLSTGLSRALAEHGVVFYVAAEEGHSPTISQRFSRLGAGHPHVVVSVYETLMQVKRDVIQTQARFVVLDSISEVDPRSAAVDEFRRWCQARGLGLWIVAHAQKSGRSYKGTSNVAHGTDIVIKVEDGEATTVKSRYAAPATVRVPMTARAMPEALRHNPAPGSMMADATSRPQTKRAKAMFARMSGSGSAKPARKTAKAPTRKTVAAKVAEPKKARTAAPKKTAASKKVAAPKRTGAAAKRAGALSNIETLLRNSLT